MITPVHRFRDIERKPEYLQPEKCVPPPSRASLGTMWFIRDGCGIACAVVTWMLVFYADFVVLLVMLVPSRDYVYSVINGTLFNTLAFLALASHFRAMLTDPVSISLSVCLGKNQAVFFLSARCWVTQLPSEWQV